MSDNSPRQLVLTADVGHFTIYRRFQNKPIPLLHPRGRSRK
jgi:hypothetical protein